MTLKPRLSSQYGEPNPILAESHPKVPWADLIWNGVSLPKHSFCTWLAIQYKLLTKDRIHGLGVDQNLCSCCHRDNESVDHLFFHCRGLTPLYKFLEMVGIETHWNNWEEVVQWLLNRRWGSKGEKLVVIFIISVATYETWKSRNYKIFREETTSKELIWIFILKILRMKVELIKKSKTGCSMHKFLVNRSINSTD
ncbi:hypothetical protein QQ045_024761 [Rhodiola kirilowii]